MKESASSPPEDAISQLQPAGLSPAARALVEALEEAFDGDSGARIFLQAALRMARRSTLPSDPDVLLDFVRAHLMGMLAEEMGAIPATAFLDRIVVALGAMTRDEPPLQGSGARESDVVWRDSARRLRSSPSLPAVEVDISAAVAPPSSADVDSDPEPPSSARESGRHRLRIRTLLVHSDRFTRALLARHLLAAGCDVLVVETFVDLATMVERTPAVAVVDMASKEVDVLLAGMVTRNPELRVIALAAPERDAARTLERAKVRTSMLLPRTVRGPDLATALRRLATQGEGSNP